MKFGLGKLVATTGVVVHMKAKEVDMGVLLNLVVRHHEGDWGDVCDDDWHANDEALLSGGRLLSAYELIGEKIWIITEHDRSVTTILFPDEY